MLEQLAGAGMSVEVSGNAPPSDGTEKPGKAAVVMVSPSGTFTKPAVDVAPIPGVPKVEGLVNTPAKDPHLAQASKLPTELPGTQVAPDQSALAPATSAASSTPVASSPAETNSQAATAEANGDTDAPSLSNNIAPSGAASAVPTESTTPASLADLPASSQWKSGQRDGTGAQDNPAAPKTPNFTNNPAGDSVPNFLAAQAPGVPASHDKAEAAQLPPSSTQAPETLSAWQSYEGGAGKIVRSARLSGSANGAEMHVEFRSGALGPMEVRAVLNDGSVGAEIHVQGQAAHTLLAAGLPSLERALGERNVRVENLTVYQDQAGGGMGGGEEQNPHSGSSPSQQHQTSPWGNPPQPRPPASGSLEGDELMNPAPGLSVRA
jgi:flagellar hook-length control protein FliK